MAVLGIVREINSAHGKSVHGHTFKIEIQFKGNVVNNMVEGIDFHYIEPIIDEVINKLDKTYIDDVLQTRATVENIAIYIINNLKQLDKLYSVTVWEGKDKYVKLYVEELK